MDKENQELTKAKNGVTSEDVQQEAGLPNQKEVQQEAHTTAEQTKKADLEVVTDETTSEDTQEEAQSQKTEEEIKIAQKVAKTEEASEDLTIPDEEVAEEEDEVDFEQLDKEGLVVAIVALKDEENMRRLDRMLKGLKGRFDEVYSSERNLALEQYLKEEGAEEDDFEYKGSEEDARFNDYFKLLRDKRQQYYRNLEQEKENNLTKKEEILAKIRELVDNDESNVSIKAIRELQDQWKAVGPIPNAHNKTLWANYHALLDRFYDARSIYFELKDLDRKKNQDLKAELCAKAEELAQKDNVKEAVTQLNELHEEYKNIGPVPNEVQEDLWQRFKAASDAIYVKRKGFVEELKKELQVNLEKKQELTEELKSFSGFSSDKITEWNDKTKVLLGIQKRWEAIGGLPKDKAKEINKHFWSTFKQFFNDKNQFFKSLESQREGNLEKKQALIDRVEELKNSTAWDNTAKEMKQIQLDWRNIGPVPEKQKNEIYKKFKTACDYFFEQKRANGKKEEEVFELNYQEKLKICDQIEQLAKSESIDLEEVYELVDQYVEIGFVPRKVVKKMHARFDAVIEVVKKSEALDEDERDDFAIQVQVNRMRSGPHGGQKVNRKEQALRRKIQRIEQDISTYKTNIEFFASSKTADKLRGEMNQNIANGEKEIEQLKKQLKVFREG